MKQYKLKFKGKDLGNVWAKDEDDIYCRLKIKKISKNTKIKTPNKNE